MGEPEFLSPEFLSSAEVAALLGVDSSTIRRRAKSHGIGRRVGGSWVFLPADIEALRAIVRDGPGNPSGFEPGNQLWQHRQRSGPRPKKQPPQKNNGNYFGYPIARTSAIRYK